MRQWTKTGVATAGVCALMVLSAGPAFADGTYHSSHYDLNPVGGAPLRTGSFRTSTRTGQMSMPTSNTS